jgi:hypothetical protein
MYIRRAPSADIEACAVIYAEVFLDDELIAWLLSRRHQYQEYYQRECLRGDQRHVLPAWFRNRRGGVRRER